MAMKNITYQDLWIKGKAGFREKNFLSAYIRKEG